MMRWRHLRTVPRDERGNATVEFVMWLPIFIALIGIVTDVSLLLNMQTRMLDVTRQASRMVSTGAMTDVEAAAWASRTLDAGAGVDVDVDVLNGFVTTTIIAPYSEAIVFGKDFLGSYKIRAHLTMWIEGESPAPDDGSNGDGTPAEAEEGA